VLLSASRAPAQDDLHHGLVQAPGGFGPFTAQVNWSPPFADANYATVCTIEADLGFVEGRVEIQAGSRTPSSMIVGVSEVAGNTGTVHCIGVANSSTISHGSAQVPGGFGPFTTQLHWSTPFPDTNYVATCSIEAELGFVEGRIEIQAGSRTPSGMIVGVSELEGASGVVSCIGVGVGPVTFACPQGQGFWKNHPDTWRVTSLTLGSQTYTQAELLALFDTPPSDDASVILAHRLIAAKLNIANGSNPAPISSAIADADKLLSQFFGKLPYNVSTSSAIGQQMVNDANVLDRYNNGDLTPSCRP
jgi:hypothetical protein